jgi:pterin-4a-carbinolamine dehydratase
LRREIEREMKMEEERHERMRILQQWSRKSDIKQSIVFGDYYESLNFTLG